MRIGKYETGVPLAVWVSALLVILGVVFLVCLGGCAARSSIEGGKVAVEKQETRRAGVTARQVSTIQHLDPDTGKVTATETVQRTEVGGETVEQHLTGNASGASAMAEGDKLEQGLNSSAPELNLGDGLGGSGGSTAATSIATITAKGGSAFLIGAGVLCILGGGAGIYFGLRTLAIILGVVGVFLIAVGLFPALIIWIIVPILGLGGSYLYSEWKAKRAHEALRAVVGGIAGVEESNPAAYAAVKAEVAKQADPADAVVIDKIKKQDNL